jgi:hypothetical protein
MAVNDNSFAVSNGSYSATWSRYRLWSWAFWIGFASYLPGLALASREFGWTRDGNVGAIFVTAFVWMLAWAAIGYQKTNFRCPRCGEEFFNKFDNRPWRMAWWHNPFARRCMHCGLRKWADKNPDSQLGT